MLTPISCRNNRQCVLIKMQFVLGFKKIVFIVLFLSNFSVIFSVSFTGSKSIF